MKSLTHLLPYLPRYEVVGELDPSISITALGNDSRHVLPGTLFIAYQGRNNDLHRFVPAAAKAGAVAAIVEQAVEGVAIPQIVVPDGREAWGWLAAAWEEHPSRSLRVIGVTGTDGKTTTMSLIASMLDALGLPYGMITTIGARIGTREVETGEHVTTPDAPIVQRFLREMVDEGMQVALLETTSHALAQHRVTGVEYDVAVVTNITHEHLDEHGSLEGYRAAKRSLFERLRTSYPKPDTPKVAILNADDSSYEYLSPLESDIQLPYSIESSAVRLRARNLRFERDGTRFTADTPIGEVEIASPLLGRFNVYNILAALGVGIVFGATAAQLQEGIAMLKVIKGRMEAIDEGQDFLAIVDFAHTPVSLENALTTAREMTSGRVISVFGSAGLRDRAKRGMMGEISGRLADLSVITAEDPRTENVEDICAEIAAGAERAGAVRDQSYVIVHDRAEAIAWAINEAKPGDLVIACGKGHEPSMCYGTTEHPWSEHEAMRGALQRSNAPTLKADC
ncbi:MAG: UDP-N-acetylmuramoyl-L-alanyl-D-glutamate--2,6-diaminopimelate ligase [Ardenticatenales bacterium]|nr:UDP-N-acetylmuramoyl-L-alanyl-D-glutamate--2,6-diaminopimelate ligase [Ardenticatenales bacterium]